MQPQAHIYFHSPCFDGIVSAVLVWDFFSKLLSWSVDDLQSINYAKRETWLTADLPPRSAVVDYLFHPSAVFWADHHSTTFLSPATREDYTRRSGSWVVYDEAAQSCAKLIADHLRAHFGYESVRYRELVYWSVITDSAQYASVNEALWGDAPALRLNNSLVYGDSNGYSAYLVRGLREMPVDAVANLPEVANRYAQYRLDLLRILDEFRHSAWLDSDIVVFDVQTAAPFFPRYAPYHWYPDASYSVGLVRRADKLLLTAMANPWREFRGPHLGKIFERFGGGGHRRVGSVILPYAGGSPEGLLAEIIETLKTSSTVEPVPQSA